MLVGGLNAGGRGYYALDVSDPAPKVMWESAPTPRSARRTDGELGLSFGNPQFGIWQDKGWCS
jgi:type IV pilus assembly protein PilY1